MAGRPGVSLSQVMKVIMPKAEVAYREIDCRTMTTMEFSHRPTAGRPVANSTGLDFVYLSPFLVMCFVNYDVMN